MCVFVCVCVWGGEVTQNVICNNLVHAFLSQLVCSTVNEQILGFLDLIFVTQLLVKVGKILADYMHILRCAHTSEWVHVLRALSKLVQ